MGISSLNSIPILYQLFSSYSSLGSFADAQDDIVTLRMTVKSYKYSKYKRTPSSLSTNIITV